MKRTASILLAFLMILAPLASEARPKTAPGPGSAGTRKTSVRTRSARRSRRAARKTGKKRGKRRRIKRDTMSLYRVNTGERIQGLPLFETRPSKPGVIYVRKSARKKLEHFMRDWRSGKVYRGMPDALWFFLYLVSYHFDTPIHVISGYRANERLTSRHRQGRAVDFRVPGVSSRRVWEYARRRFTRRGVGLGLYPRSNFLHLDIRDKTYYWVDDSGRGETARYRDGLAQPVNQWQEANKRIARRKKRAARRGRR